MIFTENIGKQSLIVKEMNKQAARHLMTSDPQNVSSILNHAKILNATLNTLENKDLLPTERQGNEGVNLIQESD